jgi:hypothetical protein
MILLNTKCVSLDADQLNFNLRLNCLSLASLKIQLASKVSQKDPKGPKIFEYFNKLKHKPLTNIVVFSSFFPSKNKIIISLWISRIRVECTKEQTFFYINKDTLKLETGLLDQLVLLTPVPLLAELCFYLDESF